ncbi:MAG: carbohydrate kinase family protein [Acidimicrobiia bacterium]|nr:carbohydrate kinase family protein [Acidimicrobiia bacterium]
MLKRYDILVAGEINPDLIVSDPSLTIRFGQHEAMVDSMSLVVGSSSAIFACGAARLGLKVGFIGIAGDDVFGRFMLEVLRQHGIDVAPVIVDSKLRTGASVILSRGEDRAILTFAGAIGALEADQVTDELLLQTRHLHVASYFLQAQLRRGLPLLFQRAHARSVTTSLDPNWDPSETWGGFDEVLPVTDVFLPNRNEALAIAGATDLDVAFARLCRPNAVVAIKLGALGAKAQGRGEVAEAAAVPVRVVDTVGAGDSFDAGFVYGYLKGWRLADCLRLACVCGSLSTEAAGGTQGQPELQRALERLERN